MNDANHCPVCGSVIRYPDKNDDHMTIRTALTNSSTPPVAPDSPLTGLRLAEIKTEEPTPGRWVHTYLYKRIGTV